MTAPRNGGGPGAAGLKIGDLAARAGVTVATVRFYERKGLLPAPARDDGNNYRTYGEADVGFVEVVKRAQGLGFTLREIRELVALRDVPKSHPALVRIAKAKSVEMAKEAKRAGEASRKLDDAVRCGGLRDLLLGGGKR